MDELSEPLAGGAEEALPPPKEREPFWGYDDLGVFVGMGLPLLVASLMIVRLAEPLGKRIGLGQMAALLVAQFVWYGLWLTALKGLLGLRYRRPFWRSLAWVLPPAGLWLPMLGGPLLAVATGGLGVLLRAPKVEIAPLEGLMGSPASIVLLVVGVAVLGPLCEELAFRGFLMPLLIRSLGAAAGIGVTALLFALLHGPEYGWSWRHVLLILGAGVAFGVVRWRSKSTLAAAVMHAMYNLTFVSAFLAGGRRG
jgi:membrane protease YdiL (CAAX protease family)